MASGGRSPLPQTTQKKKIGSQTHETAHHAETETGTETDREIMYGSAAHHADSAKDKEIKTCMDLPQTTQKQ